MIARSPAKAWMTLGLFAALLAAGCSTEPIQQRPVMHVVLMWLKHPHRQSDRAQIVRATHSLRMIPGVISAEAGEMVPPLPPEADRSFDLAAVVTFRDRASLLRYERSSRRKAAMRRYLLPLVRRHETYNLNVR